MGGDDLNDFDFNSVIKEESKKQGDGGGGDEFNFGFDDAAPKGSAPKQSSGVPDLMDLLGGGDV